MPVYLEYTKVARALEQVRDEHAAIDTNPQLIRRSLERRWDVEDIQQHRLEGDRDQQDGRRLRRAARPTTSSEPFVANVYLLVKFDKTVSIPQ